MTWVGRKVVLGGLLLLAGCDGASERSREAERPGGGAEVGGEVVSTVGGVPITLDEIESTARRTGLGPREALERLQDRELLAAEAARRGLEDHPDVRRTYRQALVQAFLEQVVEAEVTPDSIPEERVRALYESRADRYRRPERRGSVHVVARVPEDADPGASAAARRIAEEALEGFEAAEDPESVVRRYREEGARDGIDIVAEAVPPTDREGSLAAPYLEALFSRDSVGTVPAPVRTRFGWHAIHLTSIEPAVHRPLEAVRNELLEDLVTDGRRQRLETVLQELRERHPVTWREQAVERALANELVESPGPAGGS